MDEKIIKKADRDKNSDKVNIVSVDKNDQVFQFPQMILDRRNSR